MSTSACVSVVRRRRRSNRAVQVLCGLGLTKVYSQCPPALTWPWPARGRQPQRGGGRKGWPCRGRHYSCQCHTGTHPWCSPQNASGSSRGTPRASCSHTHGALSRQVWSPLPRRKVTVSAWKGWWRDLSHRPSITEVLVITWQVLHNTQQRILPPLYKSSHRLFLLSEIREFVCLHLSIYFYHLIYLPFLRYKSCSLGEAEFYHVYIQGLHF